MINVEGLSYSYDGKGTIRFADLTVAKGERLLILGESGSGKTTLLHLLGGLLRPGEGRITIAGEDISRMPESKLDHFRGQKIGFVFQRNHLVGALTVEKNLLLAPMLAGVAQDADGVHETAARL